LAQVSNGGILAQNYAQQSAAPAAAD
jgi:hypothetical protein